MVPNLGRKLAIVFLLLGVSVLLIVFKDPPFRLGLDLQGGTRLSYRFDFDQAIRDGTLSENESPADILAQTIDILYNRVDPEGVLEPIIRTEGKDRIVIELPGRARLSGEAAASKLKSLLEAPARSLELDDSSEAVAAFPESGGIVRVGDEQIRYEARRVNVLTGLTRGHLGTPVSAHAAAEDVVLVSDDAIRNAIENLGELQFFILANANDFTGSGTDKAEQERRLQEWLTANPDAPLASFNRIAESESGPSPLIRWFPDAQSEAVRNLPEGQRAVMLLNPPDQWVFRGADLGKIYYTSDELGYPAVGFELQPQRVSDFAEFTGENIGRNMAIVLNGEIRTAPTLDDRLPGRGIIRGRFTTEEVQELVTVLRTGSLKIKPILETEEAVGPSLGADYVKLGLWSGAVGLVGVVAFMVSYYRRLGGFSALSLCATMLMLMGGLAFFQATLTLPGIAGIILTVGMAVDANILVFDRIREEIDSGRNLKQAAKNGFDNALSSIVDGNLTTLITAIVLYNVGTGPVRGFAVTLSIGILASMFSALVITRILIHYSLERGAKGFPMGAWLVNANWRFIRYAPIALTLSGIAIVGGLILFASLPTTQKLGIDFTGGGMVMFRTEQPEEVDTIRERIKMIEGDIGQSAEVKPVISTARDGRYTGFRTTFKVDPARVGSGDVTGTFASVVSDAVGDMLQKGPVEVAIAGEEATHTADLRLYFEESHPSEDVANRLSTAGFRDVSVQSDSSRPEVFTAKLATADLGDPLAIQAQVQNAFLGTRDSKGVDFRFSDPIPEKALVGAQVVGELQDKAILALVISLFATVMYIRVRFAEYSYGLSAVAAVFHDVLVTLGAVSVGILTGIVELEIDLPMIAAFLTIIGYSLNDTIVIFDRVRENLPRIQKPLAEVVDISINQTLSRTILTSGTVFLVVSVLFIFNLGTGNVLEGFGFAMVVGVMVGTYSTIYIACPLLVWLEGRKKRVPVQTGAVSTRAS